jgi:transposase-like protein
MNIREAHAKFFDDEQCLTYIAQMRWPDGVTRCPTCGSNDVKRVERSAESKNRRKWFYLCLERTCHNQFTPTSGTIFHDTHLPLIVWFQAIALMLNAKKGLSAAQLQRDLGIGGYKTAWYLNHRIREAMKEGQIPMLGGIVEIDETYIGGKTIRRKNRGNRRYAEKDAVVGMVERGGRVRFRYIGKGSATADRVRPVVRENVSRDVERVITDESIIYPRVFDGYIASKHETVCHESEYVHGKDTHTNTIESAFSLLKRGLIGSFHKVSIKHLARYLAEFEYRFNRRKAEEDVFLETVRRLCGIAPLPFTQLTSEPSVSS